MHTLATGVVVVLAAAVSASDPGERPDPAWLEQICAEVSTC